MTSSNARTCGSGSSWNNCGQVRTQNRRIHRNDPREKVSFHGRHTGTVVRPERSETERKRLDARTDALTLALDDEAKDAPTDGKPPEAPRPEEEPVYTTRTIGQGIRQTIFALFTAFGTRSRARAAVPAPTIGATTGARLPAAPPPAKSPVSRPERLRLLTDDEIREGMENIRNNPPNTTQQSEPSTAL
jgi:hypothetical protein